MCEFMILEMVQLLVVTQSHDVMGVISPPSSLDSQMVRKKEINISQLIGTTAHTYLHTHLLSIMYIQLFTHFSSKHSMGITQD